MKKQLELSREFSHLSIVVAPLFFQTGIAYDRELRVIFCPRVKSCNLHMIAGYSKLFLELLREKFIKQLSFFYRLLGC